jgi:hypothetical protein
LFVVVVLIKRKTGLVHILIRGRIGCNRGGMGWRVGELKEEGGIG